MFVTTMYIVLCVYVILLGIYTGGHCCHKLEYGGWAFAYMGEEVSSNLRLSPLFPVSLLPLLLFFHRSLPLLTPTSCVTRTLELNKAVWLPNVS